MQFVPVLSSTGQRLMPAHAARARELVRKGRAVRRFDRGLFYIRLLDREAGDIQPMVAGIDPGSKKEAYSVISAKRTFLNIQADAVTWVSEAEATSTQMRRSRRQRKTPYRQQRHNRRQGQFKLPPSTRARWGWKLRLCHWLARYYPIDTFAVEDIQAQSKPGKRRWNQSFSPLEVGKRWFYEQLEQAGQVKLFNGYETFAVRHALWLKKPGKKMSDAFEAHCIDAWTLANMALGSDRTAPDNKAMLFIVPLRFHRRQLHLLQPAKGGIRRRYGGTGSLGFKRGSWVKHPQHGICYVGGTTGATVSLHALQTGTRIAKVKPATLQFLTRSSWRVRKEVSASHRVKTRCPRRKFYGKG